MEKSKAKTVDKKAIFMIVFVTLLALMVMLDISLNIANEIYGQNSQQLVVTPTPVETEATVEPLPTLSQSGDY